MANVIFLQKKIEYSNGNSLRLLNICVPSEDGMQLREQIISRCCVQDHVVKETAVMMDVSSDN